MSDLGGAPKCLRTPTEMHRWRDENPVKLGLVPTMGYLHEGHLSLIRRSCVENVKTVVSIFVNPTQFGIGEDLAVYPRDEERDLALLTEMGVDAVYIPSSDSMYPPDFQTFVSLEGLTRHLEGASRPNHFRGVATVVTKLFSVVHPERSYFGKKDAQQLRVIQRLVADLNMPVEIIPCDTVRESDGLALSSRNVHLSSEERKVAPLLYKSLQKARSLFDNGERCGNLIRDAVREILSQESLFEIDYVSLTDDQSLIEIEGLIERPGLIMVAVKLGSVRLLDNIELRF